VATALAGRWRGGPLRYPTDSTSARRLTSGFSDYRQQAVLSNSRSTGAAPKGETAMYQTLTPDRSDGKD
jgi:hypothetical protein